MIKSWWYAASRQGKPYLLHVGHKDVYGWLLCVVLCCCGGGIKRSVRVCFSAVYFVLLTHFCRDLCLGVSRYTTQTRWPDFYQLPFGVWSERRGIKDKGWYHLNLVQQLSVRFSEWPLDSSAYPGIKVCVLTKTDLSVIVIQPDKKVYWLTC